LEVQIVELAFAAAACQGALKDAAAAAAAARSVVNDVANLNVTSKRVNQAKRGPFTALSNRVQNPRLRMVSAEQLARQGAARWLVDEGHWPRVQREVVVSWEAFSDRLGDDSAAHSALSSGAASVLDAAMSGLCDILSDAKLLA
jgi:hypothetical protein